MTDWLLDAAKISNLHIQVIIAFKHQSMTDWLLDAAKIKQSTHPGNYGI